MEVGYQVGQVVLRGTVDLQQQWRDHLEQFRAARDAVDDEARPVVMRRWRRGLPGLLAVGHDHEAGVRVAVLGVGVDHVRAVVLAELVAGCRPAGC